MISLEKSETKKKGTQYYAKVTGFNNEPLMNGELVTTKHSAIKQAKAAARQFGAIKGEHFFMQDNTLKKPKEKLIFI
jgi:hypothetical protein